MLITVLGALLGTQNGREVEVVNTFELAIEEGDGVKVDHGFLVSRKDQCAYYLYIFTNAI
jgi:COP9 signalosome complex subunit 6